MKNFGQNISLTELREIPFDSDDYRIELALRTRVLREPLGLRFTPEELALEPRNMHLGLFEDGELRGCLLLLPKDANTIKMRQVAIEPRFQGRGYGRRLVEFSEDYARERGYREMILHARDTAAPFYLALGYAILGEPFVEVGIPHVAMRKTW